MAFWRYDLYCGRDLYVYVASVGFMLLVVGHYRWGIGVVLCNSLLRRSLELFAVID